jgi:ornithine cyclodeaminase/alanine dehydrogenase-like protein (mu-crystallin family)
MEFKIDGPNNPITFEIPEIPTSNTNVAIKRILGWLPNNNKEGNNMVAFVRLHVLEC